MNQDVSRRDIPSGRGEPSAGRAALAGERGAGDDVATTVNVLNQALTIAHITVLRCKRQYRIALRHHSPPLAAAALEHANGAKEHVGRVTERIVQLGGKPNARLNGRIDDGMPQLLRSGSGTVIADARTALHFIILAVSGSTLS